MSSKLPGFLGYLAVAFLLLTCSAMAQPNVNVQAVNSIIGVGTPGLGGSLDYVQTNDVGLGINGGAATLLAYNGVKTTDIAAITGSSINDVDANGFSGALDITAANVGEYNGFNTVISNKVNEVDANLFSGSEKVTAQNLDTATNGWEAYFNEGNRVTLNVATGSIEASVVNQAKTDNVLFANVGQWNIGSIDPLNTNVEFTNAGFFNGAIYAGADQDNDVFVGSLGPETKVKLTNAVSAEGVFVGYFDQSNRENLWVMGSATNEMINQVVAKESGFITAGQYNQLEAHFFGLPATLDAKVSNVYAPTNVWDSEVVQNNDIDVP